MNSASTSSDLLVRHALSSFFKLIGPLTGKNRMSVSINETRQDDSPAGIHDIALLPNQLLDLRAWTYFGDAGAKYEQRAIFDDRQVTQLWPNAGTRRTSQRHELRAIDDG